MLSEQYVKSGRIISSTDDWRAEGKQGGVVSMPTDEFEQARRRLP